MMKLHKLPSISHRFASAVRRAGLIICLFALAGCADKEVRLSGDREDVLSDLRTLMIDEQASAELAGLGNAVVNSAFGHPGVTSAHDGGHLSLDLPLKQLWKARIEETESDVVMLAQPVIVNGKVFALGADALVSVFDLETGKVLATEQIDDAQAGLFPGVAGGLAANEKVLIAHAGRKMLTAIDSNTNQILWSVENSEPLAGGPTLIGNEGVIVTDIDGSTLAFRLNDGALVWQTTGLPADTVVLGSGSPTVHKGTVIVAGIGGEVSANAVADGKLIWADSLATLAPRTPLEELGDILANPVHDGDAVYVVSQSGILGAFDSLTGIQLWEQPISSVQMPWVAGESLFVLTTSSHLVALRKSDGAVRWHTDLPGSAELAAISATDVTRYFGPIVAAGQVHVLSSSGRIYSLNADTGVLVDKQSLSGAVNVDPIIAQNTLVVLTRSGRLVAWR